MSSSFMTSWFAFGQAQLARSIRSVLDLEKELGERQAAASIELLQAQLAIFTPDVTTAMQNLFDIQAGLLGNLTSQWLAVAGQVVERGGACIGDLRQAQNRDEAGGVLVMFAKDLADRAHDDAERAGSLLGSAGAAQRILVERTLDDMVKQRAPDPGAGE